MTDLRQLNAWVADALRFHGCEPDPMFFPARLMSRTGPGLGGFSWVYRREGKQFEMRTAHGRLCNYDVAAMLFRAGVRVEIPEEDLNGERHPRFAGTELLDGGVRKALIDDEPAGHHKDTREAT